MKRADFVLIVSIGVIALSLALSLFKSNTVNVEGYTQKEVNYLLEIQNLKNDTKTLKYEIEKFKESIIKDSIFVHNASNQQIDSLFTSYFK
tara:strand:- start:1129 stop:1401 length:273 start_codon:yes stop_codon:yes gene_type:complete